MSDGPADIPPPPPADRRTWIERHWLKVLGLLALGGAGTLLLCCGGAVFILSGSLRSNAVVDMTIRRLADEPRVIARTGEPITPGWFVLGSIHWKGDAGDAALSIPVTGPDGSVQADVRATRHAGVWRLDRLTVRFGGTDETLTLIEEGAQR